jgi:Pentapeptide repeats (8 copies)
VVQCSACPVGSRDRLQVRALSALWRIPSAVLSSPWCWPLVPLVAVAAIGQWVSVTAAEEAAAACGVCGIGIVIGLVLAGAKAGAVPLARKEQRSTSPQAPSNGQDGGSAQQDPGITDLRGARLVNAKLVDANLRRADLRGATLTGADLSGADLTGARLGPLDDTSGTR